MSASESMSPSDFIGYCYIHSETPRALFIGKDITHLFELAGKSPPAIREDAFYAMYSEDVHPLCEKAELNLLKVDSCPKM